VRKNLIIVGGGGFAKEIICLAKECGFEVVGVLDDALSIGTRLLDVEVVGVVSEWVDHSHCGFVVAVGSPRARKYIVDSMSSFGNPDFVTLVHSSVSLSSHVSLGKGSIVGAGCVLTVDINIGQHCIININSTVGHDTVIGDFCTISPVVAVSGNVEMCEMVEIGTGASIRQGVSLKKGAMLGMGGVLTKDVSAYQVYVGNPAVLFKTLES